MCMPTAKQNQKFPFHFLSAPPTPPAEEKKKGKENFWFLLPRPKGADEARRLVGIRILLKMRSDFVVQREQEKRPFRVSLAPHLGRSSQGNYTRKRHLKIALILSISKLEQISV